MEVRVQPDEQDDEQVPQHCGQIHAQEQGKEHALLLMLNGEPQEEELRHAALVLSPHAFPALAWNWKSGKPQRTCHKIIVMSFVP